DHKRVPGRHSGYHGSVDHSCVCLCFQRSDLGVRHFRPVGTRSIYRTIRHRCHACRDRQLVSVHVPPGAGDERLQEVHHPRDGREPCPRGRGGRPVTVFDLPEVPPRRPRLPHVVLSASLGRQHRGGVRGHGRVPGGGGHEGRVRIPQRHHRDADREGDRLRHRGHGRGPGGSLGQPSQRVAPGVHRVGALPAGEFAFQRPGGELSDHRLQGLEGRLGHERCRVFYQLWCPRLLLHLRGTNIRVINHGGGGGGPFFCVVSLSLFNIFLII
ncbi:unnamed protein product, partial [Lymnaea stagnalis]